MPGLRSDGILHGSLIPVYAVAAIISVHCRVFYALLFYAHVVVCATVRRSLCNTLQAWVCTEIHRYVIEKERLFVWRVVSPTSSYLNVYEVL